MKILIAAGIYPPDSGGPAIHAQKQYEWFKSHGVKVRLVALAHYRSLPKFLRHWVYLAILMTKSFGVQMIYAHDAVGSGLPAAIVSKLFGKKLIVRIGGDLAWERAVGESQVSLIEWYESGAYKENKFFKHSLWVLKRADKIIVPAVILSDIYIKYYGIEKNKIEVIHNPVPEVPVFESKTEQKIIFASRLVAYKNLELVLKALVSVFEKYPELKFVVMGDGPERGKLESLVQKLSLKDKVIFRGQVSQEEVLKETSSSLLILAPAVTEFNPNYLLQGLSYSKPFIVSKGNGLPFEVPADFIFDPHNQAELTEKISHIFEPVNYALAVEWVKNLQFQMNWEDNLKANFKVVSGV